MINSVTNSRANQTAKQKSSLPAVPNMLTNGQSNLSETEFDKKLMDLARRDVAAGRNSKFITPKGKTLRTDEWFKLSQDYISSASPDRKGLINKTMSSLAGRLGSMGIGFNRMNFFDALFKNSHIFGSSGNFGNATVGSNFVNFKDDNGNIIASFDEFRGWVAHTTPAETAQRQEFYAKWDDALTRAAAELSSGSQAKQAQSTEIVIDKKV